MRTLVIILALLLLVLAGGLAFIYSGAYDVAATAPHSGFVKWALSTTMDHSVASRAVSVEVPEGLSNPSRVEAGAAHYAETCQGCHGGPGVEAAELAKGLNPPAPDLAESGEEMSTQELFWVIKNGVKMTGMPAFGPTHEDDELWSITAFVKALPNISPARYAQLTETAEEGHHAEEGAKPDTGDERMESGEGTTGG